MLNGAYVFCSIQPCNRKAEGDLEFEQDGQLRAVSVCPRHAEYIMAYFGGEVEDPDVLSQEIVFVDDVGRDSMIDQIIKYGRPLEIIDP